MESEINKSLRFVFTSIRTTAIRIYHLYIDYITSYNDLKIQIEKILKNWIKKSGDIIYRESEIQYKVFMKNVFSARFNARLTIILLLSLALVNLAYSMWYY